MSSTMELPASASSSSTTFPIFAFIDHSNINISAQRTAGRDGHFPDGVDDPCVKVIPCKVFDFLDSHHREKGGHLAELFCYTSDQNVLQHENIGDRKITARGFTRSNWTKREKCVDTYMVADAIETIMLEKDKDTSGILSLWTGDKDILAPIMDKARKYKWKVETWTFKSSRSNALENYEGIEVKSLDEHYRQIVERKTGWKPNDNKLPPPESSFKLQFDIGSEELNYARENWRDLVEHMTRKAEIPLQTWFNWEKGLLYFILAVQPKDAKKHMWKVFEKKEALQETARSYLDIKFNLRSTCKLMIEETYPPAPQASKQLKQEMRKERQTGLFQPLTQTKQPQLNDKAGSIKPRFPSNFNVGRGTGSGGVGLFGIQGISQFPRPPIPQSFYNNSARMMGMGVGHGHSQGQALGQTQSVVSKKDGGKSRGGGNSTPNANSRNKQNGNNGRGNPDPNGGGGGPNLIEF